MDQSDDAPIPLVTVNSATLRMVIEWCSHHKDDYITAPELDENATLRSDDISAWDMEFLKVDTTILYDLLMVSVMPISLLFRVIIIIIG